MVLVIPDDWTDSIESILKQFPNSGTIVVLGCKGSGKSTFVRTLTDSYLKSPKCATSTIVLDTDCGQPDKTPPGTLSLYVKSAVEDTRVVHRIVSQRFFGFVNPATAPFAYTAKVAEVFADYSSNSIVYSGMPLIVNCHGWGTGCGRETWEAVISIVRPDLVVYLGPGEFVLSSSSNAFVTDLGLSLLGPVTTMPLSKVIVIDGTDDDSSDKRWVKIASHFRPDLKTFTAMNPTDFFKIPFVRKLKVLNCDNISHTIVGVIDKESNQCVCLGYVVSQSDDETEIYVPPNIPSMGDVLLVRSRELNWSPRDAVSHEGKRTLINFSPEPQLYFLPYVLGGAGAKVASGRTNLKRIKHSH